MTEIPRKVIAFYNPATGLALHQSPIHQHLEVVLNYLGLDVIHWSTADPLPTPEQMQGVRAVVSWFFDDHAVPNPEQYCTWVTAQMDHGVKWVSLNKMGLYAKDQTVLSPTCVTLFGRLGAEFAFEQTEDPIFLEIISKDHDMVEFERDLSFAEQLRYALIKVHADPALHCYLKMRRTDMDDSDSCLVFTSPGGGFVQATLVTYENLTLNKFKWRLNPFRFFTEAFALDDMPVPDVTTINGRRIFMSHIDGDGIFNVSKIDRTSYSGEVIQKKILAAYQNVPISVSIITGYLDLPEYAGDRERNLYRDIFTLPNVEPASHGYAHPLIWSTDALAAKGYQGQALQKSQVQADTVTGSSNKSQNQNAVSVALDIPGYKMNSKMEITGSTERLRSLLKSLKIDKLVDTFFWTGNCLPDESQIVIADDAGLLSVNGGDSRDDRVADSVAFLKPIGLKRGNHRQIYSNFGNENVFTNLWQGPFYGYRDVSGSFDTTETPRRLKAIDIYYHFYSGERNESFTVLKDTYDQALSGSVFPVFTSRYIKMANDYFAARLYHIPGGYRVANQGDLRTIRLNAPDKNIDMRKSVGVVGFGTYQQQLFVHLDGSTSHDIYLTDTSQDTPYIVNASFDVTDWRREGESVSFLKSGWFKSSAVLGGFKARTKFQVTAGDNQQVLTADQEGHLSVDFPQAENGGAAVLVSIKRESL